MVTTPFPSWIIFELCFTGSISNRKPSNHEFAFISLVLHFILTTFHSDCTAFKCEIFTKYFFSLSLISIHCWIHMQFLQFYIRHFMLFRKSPYHFMIDLCLVFKALTPFRIQVFLPSICKFVKESKLEYTQFLC